MLRRSGSVGAVPRAAPRQVSSHARPAASRLPAALAADHPPPITRRSCQTSPQNKGSYHPMHSAQGREIRGALRGWPASAPHLGAAGRRMVP